MASASPARWLIVAFHYGVTFWHAPSVTSPIRWRGSRSAPAEPAAHRHGWIGVELFFVISGMAIARSARGLSRADLSSAAWHAADARRVDLRDDRDAGRLPPGWAWSGELVDRLAPLDRLLACIRCRSTNWYWTLGVELAFYLRGRRGARRGGSSEQKRPASRC